MPPRTVGRDPELGTIRAALNRAVDGRGSTIVIEGDAGIGKSHLLDAARAEAAALGFDVLAGRAEEFELGRPFGALLDAFDLRSATPRPEAADVARRLSNGATSDHDPQHLRFAVIDAAIETLERCAANGPVLLTLDDLQWADAGTLQAAAGMARRVEALPAVVVVTARAHEPTSALAQLVDRMVSDGHRHLRLGPLAAADVGALAAAMLEAQPDDGLDALLARTGGNPFLLTQLLDGLSEDGSIVSRDGVATLVGDDLPATVHATMQRRVGRLSTDAQEVLRIGAVIGPSFSMTPVAAVLDRPLPDLTPAVNELVTAGMVADDDGLLSFRHQLLRDVVYRSVPSSTRVGVHHQVGRALSRGGHSPVVVAEHFLAAAQPGDALAAEWARRAARELLAADTEAALRVLDRAASLCAEQPGCRAGVELDRARALASAGRYVEAEAVLRSQSFHTAAAGSDELSRQATAALSHVLYEQARWDDVVAELTPLANSEPDGCPYLDRMRARLASAHAAAGEVEAAERHAHAVLDGGPHGDAAARSEAYIALAWAASGRGPVAAAVEHAGAAVIEAARDGSWDAYRRHPHVALAFALAEADRWAAAAAALEEGRRLADTLVASWDDSMYDAAAAMLALRTGRWAEADAAVASGFERCDVTGGRVALPLLWTVRLALARHRGQAAEVDAAMVAANDFATAAGIGATQLRRQVALAAADRGDTEAALEAVTPIWQTAERSLWAYVAVDLVRLATGRDAALVASVVERLDGYATTSRSSHVAAIAGHCRGLADGTVGDVIDAAAGYRALGLVPVAAEALTDAARLVAATDPSEARRLLAEAEESWSGVGADARLADVRDLAAAIGGRRRAAPSTETPVTGWDSLTASELKVAELVADGLTNSEVGRQLFISPRTVESHLSRVFAKLQIRSRTQLAATAHQRPT